MKPDRDPADPHEPARRERHGEPRGAPFVVTLVALLGLTGLSFALSFASLGAAATPVALAIALLKVLLVATVFMELRQATFTSRAVGLVALAFVALLCLGLLGDVELR